MKNEIREILDLCFKSQKIQVQNNTIKNLDKLIELNILKIDESNSSISLINIESNILNKSLLEYAEQCLGRKISIISEIFSFVEDFKEFLKSKYKVPNNIVNTYSSILNNLTDYMLLHLKLKEVDIKGYYIERIKNKEKQENDFYLFKNSFFRSLLNLEYNLNEIWEICLISSEYEENEYFPSFINKLPSKNIELAKKLYNVGIIQNSKSKIITNLLVGLYNAGDSSYLKNIKELVKINPSEGFSLLGYLNLRTKKENLEIFKIIKKDSQNNFVLGKTNALCKLIENDKIDDKTRESCFLIIKSYLKIDDKDKVDGVFRSITYHLDNYEKEKYGLLHVYLNSTKNIRVLNDFFYRFKNPQYIFNLIVSLYGNNWKYSSLQILFKQISHFWDLNINETENYILALFNPEGKFGMLPVYIIMGANNDNPLPINLLKLKTKEEQIKSIDAICLYSHSFDKLLPIVLQLRKSSFNSVVEFLQTKLSQLLFEAYPNSLYEAIKNLLDNTQKDKLFFKSIDETYLKYLEIEKKKKSINDLNPIDNERDLMNLYYSLEHENKAQMLKDIDENPNSLLKLFGGNSKTIIVRGNSWKQELQDDVRPLGRIEVNMWVDARLYRNPDEYQHILDNYV